MPTSDTPSCPMCGYEVRSGTGPVCSECGQTLPSDPRELLPSVWRTPWSATRPQLLLRGIPVVLVHPGKTLRLTDLPGRVTAIRAGLFALSISLLTVALWDVARTALCMIGLAFNFSFPAWRAYALRWSAWQHVLDASHWLRLAKWEAFSLTRWWLFYGFVVITTTALMRRSSVRASGPALSGAMIRLLLLSAWFPVLEIAIVIGTLIHEGGNTIPEPSTIFGGEWWTGWFRAAWLVRAGLPVLVVNYLCLRHVARVSPRWCLVLAAAWAPVALWVCVAWSKLYIVLLNTEMM